VSEPVVIDCALLWAYSVSAPHAMREVQRWLRLHGINPSDVPTTSDLIVQDSPYGALIRYKAFARSPSGSIVPDPHDPDRVAVKDRTAILRAPIPGHWPAARTPRKEHRP